MMTMTTTTLITKVTNSVFDDYSLLQLIMTKLIFDDDNDEDDDNDDNGDDNDDDADDDNDNGDRGKKRRSILCHFFRAKKVREGLEVHRSLGGNTWAPTGGGGGTNRGWNGGGTNGERGIRLYGLA